MQGIDRIAARRRPGFTLVELLVVIAIIAILAGLLMAGVMVFLRKGPEVQNRNDLLQLAQALQKFKSERGQYPPSLIRLRANMADYSNPATRLDALDDFSSSYLRSVMWKSLPAVTNIPWAGSTPMPAGGIVLEGDQCLMFFLCGPPNQGGNAAAGFMGGFNNDAANPVGATATPIRYMDVPNVGRLTIRQNSPPNLPGVAQLFPSYLDAYGNQPIMYFSAGNRPNGYQGGSNSLGITPYFKSAGQFYNSDSFQLISAGADSNFGPGGQWPPIAVGPGADDITNFSDKAMGIP
jgi:prepilin-type N-terminal cleavage/methylation domain-containing protein